MPTIIIDQIGNRQKLKAFQKSIIACSSFQIKTTNCRFFLFSVLDKVLGWNLKLMLFNTQNILTELSWETNLLTLCSIGSNNCLKERGNPNSSIQMLSISARTYYPHLSNHISNIMSAFILGLERLSSTPLLIFKEYLF